MNERIKELAHEAGLPTYNPSGVPSKLEKFAKLIVWECANICYNSNFQDSDAHANNLLYEFNIDNCRIEK